MNELVLIGGSFAAVMIGVIVFAIVVKMKEVQGAQNWTATTGKVIRSGIRAHQKRQMEGRDTIKNQPSVVYEYTVRGKRYTGERISLGDSTPESEIEATLARYPVGVEVTVYYNPANPRQAVLERALPPDFGKGITSLLVFFGFGAALILFTIAKGPELVAPLIPNPDNALFVTLSGGIGILLLLFGFVQQREALAAQTWSSANGTVVSSEIRSFIQWKDNREHIYYTPVIIYRYTVAGREYTNDRYSLGAEVSWNKPSFVQKTIEQYPVDAPVTVYYNPKAPAESVLDRRVNAGWLIWVLGIGMLVLAVASTGIL